MIELKAKPLAEKIRAEVAEKAARFIKKAGRAPKLVVMIVGEDPASVIYTSKKAETANSLGFLSEVLRFSANASPQEVKLKVDSLNSDDTVDGILIQRPLPGQFSESEVLTWVAAEKDVDGFHPLNVGKLSLGLPSLVPCTPLGIMKLLEHFKIDVRGKLACVIGRSATVGKPMAKLLLNANASVIQVHSQTQNLASLSKQAEILVVAAGKPKMITKDFVKPGAVVVDVGIHRNPSGVIFGDCDFASVASVAQALTPVPGGVGPMTIAILMQNTLEAAARRMGITL